jgi:hypothetical protein
VSLLDNEEEPLLKKLLNILLLLVVVSSDDGATDGDPQQQVSSRRKTYCVPFNGRAEEEEVPMFMYQTSDQDARYDLRSRLTLRRQISPKIR